MKTMKIWRNISVMCAALLSLASCSSNDNVEILLTHTQKETYGKNISGEYSGEYIIIYKDKDCTDMTDEKGRHIITKAHEAIFDNVQLDVSDYKMQHIFFQDFPISLISKVVDADEELSHALAGASPQAITARYGFDYDTDYSHIKWAFIPNVMLLNLNYGGADHHIRIEFKNNYNYICAADELTQPNSFLSLAKTGVALQLKAIYDGSNLIQRFGAEEGNYMHIIFKAEL